MRSNTSSSHYLTIFLFLTCIIYQSKSQCGFTQTCVRTPGQEDAACPDVNNSNVPIRYLGPPRVNNSTIMDVFKKVCPQYADTGATCCNDDQVKIMEQNFSSIDALFGYCPICAKNLKQFWCVYTCDTNQGKFVNATGQIVTPDNTTVLNLDLKVKPQMSCNIWQSCKKIPFASEVSTSADAFMQFMGINAKTTGKTQINMQFVNQQYAILTNSTLCEAVVPDDGIIDGYKGLKNCTCTYCETQCNVAGAPPFPTFFEGFNWIAVVIVYAALLVISIVIIVIKWRCSNKKTKKNKLLVNLSESPSQYTFEQKQRNRNFLEENNV